MSIKSFDRNSTIINNLEETLGRLKTAHAALQEVVGNPDTKTWQQGLDAVRGYDEARVRVDKVVHEVFQASNLLDDNDTYLKELVEADREMAARAAHRDEEG
jgi:hypothetical protein